LFDCEEPDAILDACHASGAPLVAALRCRGLVYPTAVGASGRRPPRRRSTQPARATASTAFAARIVAGDEPIVAARYANAAAAIATTGYGAVAPLPRHADVASLLSRR
jgi:2-dehydro-3-deoxygluconokinase